MDYQQTLEYLYSALPMYQRVGPTAYKKDLTNTVEFSERLDNPHQKFKSVHIAGTNGKGSSAHMIAAILQCAGYKTGLYTSPHLKSFTERIKINGVAMEEQAVVDFVSKNKDNIEDIKPSFFETTVVMAFNYFAKQEVDIAVIEVGLGGRLDSTNVITPLVSLITSIGYDHQQMLGETLEEIAGEKAGIIKTGIPVVSNFQEPAVLEVLKNVAQSKNAPFTFAEKCERNYPLDLKGAYQKYNVPGVLKVIDLLKQIGFTIEEEHIAEGLAHTTALTGLKGRWQTINTKPLTICDTAHNQQGVEAILNQIKTLTFSKLHMVWGTVNDKDIKKILELLPKEANYYFCQPNVPRGLDVDELSRQALDIGLNGVKARDVNEAIRMAQAQANDEDLIYIGGSTFVVAEIEGL